MITIPTSNRAEKPKGAPFYVDRVSFRPGERVDVARFTLADDKVFDWPMVYILANKDTAYVGQTTSIATRMNQHGANEEKRDFDTINVIYNEEFNGSVITDYEHRLIGYMHADGRYKLTNKNEGMTDSNYFSKGAYSAMFEDLWEELRALELADHTIADIEESEVFKCSPFKGLNADQRVALDKIMAAIRDGIDKAEPIVVEGMPGTGKTVLDISAQDAARRPSLQGYEHTHHRASNLAAKDAPKVPGEREWVQEVRRHRPERPSEASDGLRAWQGQMFRHRSY